MKNLFYPFWFWFVLIGLGKERFLISRRFRKELFGVWHDIRSSNMKRKVKGNVAVLRGHDDCVKFRPAAGFRTDRMYMAGNGRRYHVCSHYRNRPDGTRTCLLLGRAVNIP